MERSSSTSVLEMDSVPTEIWAVIMFHACDELFPAPAAALSERLLVLCTSDDLKTRMNGNSGPDVITFVRKSYRPMQRMRRVCRATADPQNRWLMKDEELYNWLDKQWRTMTGHGKSYKINYDFYKTLEHCDLTDPKTRRLALRLWLTQPDAAVLKLRQSKLFGYSTINNIDASLLDTLHLSKATRNLRSPELPPVTGNLARDLFIDAKRVAAGKESLSYPLVRIADHGENNPATVEYLDEMEWIPAPFTVPPNIEQCRKCIRHIPTGALYDQYDFFKHVYSGTRRKIAEFRDMKRETLERALRVQHELKQERKQLRQKLKKRRVPEKMKQAREERKKKKWWL